MVRKMIWKWCEMCLFDGHCENQDRNMECACYAREQTLRAEQYGNLIDKLQKQLEIAVEVLEEYANEDHWCGCIAGFNPRQIDSGCYGCYGFTEAQEALIKIKDVEK